MHRSDGSWSGWVEPLADRIRLDTARLRRAQRHLDRQHRAGSPECFNPDGTHQPGRCGWQRSAAATQTWPGWPSCTAGWLGTARRCTGRWPTGCSRHGADIACEKLDYVAWQKNFPRSVRDRAPGLLVQMMRRKAESAGGDRLYEFNPKTTALSQTCLCGDRKKKPLSQRVHRCGCGITEHRDLFSAYLGLHVRRRRMVSTGWTCRQPTRAGSTVRTSTGRRGPAEQHHSTGEAADIRRRGGQWRASTPGASQSRDASDHSGGTGR